jgi:hypothetical protein
LSRHYVLVENAPAQPRSLEDFPPPTPLDTPCRIWQGAVRGGYGIKWVRNHRVAAHRWAWEQAHGPIPDGMVILHACDNKLCFRIDHLSLGTPADNSRDMANKGRSARGERHGQARLSPDQVRAIRNDPRTGFEIAADYGITQPHVSAIKVRRVWAHLE